MRPGVLVTRPLPQAASTGARLSEMGYTPTLSPMLHYETVDPVPAIDLTDVQAILLTSAHAARALGEVISDRSVSVLAVGDHTADTARKLGFTRVVSARGDAMALADLAAKLSPEDGAILHVRGEHVARSPLSLPEGFKTREAILYRTVQTSRLSEEAEMTLTSGRLSAVLVYSARTAEALARCLGTESPAGLALIGISPAAMAPLTRHAFASRVAATDPTEASLLAALAETIPPV